MISSVSGLVEQSTGQALNDGKVESIKKTIQQGEIKKASQDFEA